MKYIKLFENYNQLEWKSKILETTKILDVLYDLRDLSLEYLDVKYKIINDDGEEENLNKKIIFTVDLNSREDGYIENLFGGEYSFEYPEIEENLNWDFDILKWGINFDDKLIDGLKDGHFYLNITLCIVADNDGHLLTVSDDTSEVYKMISNIHPEMEFDTFNPWDLN
jgi:hypothetical protein